MFQEKLLCLAVEAAEFPNSRGRLELIRILSVFVALLSVLVEVHASCLLPSAAATTLNVDHNLLFVQPVTTKVAYHC